MTTTLTDCTRSELCMAAARRIVRLVEHTEGLGNDAQRQIVGALAGCLDDLAAIDELAAATGSLR